jgi:hypothetical protein
VRRYPSVAQCCLQQPISFDANGDTPRKVIFTEIRNG